MGMYIFISEADRIKMSAVEDSEVNDLLREARAHDSMLLAEQRSTTVRKWFKKTISPVFSIYHESPAWDGSAYQARYSISGSGRKEVAIAYLTGIINGSIARKMFYDRQINQ